MFRSKFEYSKTNSRDLSIPSLGHEAVGRETEMVVDAAESGLWRCRCCVLKTLPYIEADYQGAFDVLFDVSVSAA